MFKKDTTKESKQAMEAVKVPNYGDNKIDEAKGNLSIPNPLSFRLIGADPQTNEFNDHLNQNGHGRNRKQASHLRREVTPRESKSNIERSDHLT